LSFDLLPSEIEADWPLFNGGIAMFTIKAIETRLSVADVKRSAAFYHELLGMNVGTLWPEERPEFAILHRDGLRLQLGASEAASIGSCTLCFDVSDAKALHAHVKKAVSIDWEPEVYFYHRREFAFRDPDGHTVIVSEVTDDPVTCAE
jgi:catechol 2,3-dioxygenase-like lactoylglutathione lyase family enzyme